MAVPAAGEFLRALGADTAEGRTAAEVWADVAGEGIRQAGIHTWAGGAATTDSITVTGLLATDLILVNISIQGSGSPTSVIGINDASNDQIDLIMDQNGQDGTTKIDYLVLIPGAL